MKQTAIGNSKFSLKVEWTTYKRGFKGIFVSGKGYTSKIFFNSDIFSFRKGGEIFVTCYKLAIWLNS